MDSIQEVIRTHQDELMSLPNVVGIGRGERNGETVIKVLVRQKVAAERLEPAERVPNELAGFPCDVQELGVVQAQDVKAQDVKENAEEQ